MQKNQAPVRIDPATLERYACECGNNQFVQIHKFFSIPSLMQAMVGGQDTLSLMSFLCTACNKSYVGPQTMVKLMSETAHQSMLTEGQTADDKEVTGEKSCSNTSSSLSLCTDSEKTKT